MNREIRTKVIFDLIKLEENNLIVDPNSICVNGYFKWYLLDEFLFEGFPNDDYVEEFFDKMKEGECYEVEIEVWEDSDDDNTWIDYKILNHLLK